MACARWSVHAVVLLCVWSACGAPTAVTATRVLFAGGDQEGRVSWWNGSEWRLVGTFRTTRGPPAVNAFVEYQGDLVVAGAFEAVGTTPAFNIARWDGRRWSTMGTFIDGAVNALASNGTHLFAGGRFTGGSVVYYNGLFWSAILGYNIDDGPVYALVASGSMVYAGGNFSVVDFRRILNVAAWNGASWLDTGFDVDGTVRALAIHQGVLYAGGSFAGRLHNVARWNSTAWEALVVDGVPGLPNTVYALTSYGGVLAMGGQSQTAFWDGTRWVSNTTTSVVGLLTAETGVLYGASGYYLGVDTIREWRPATSTWLGIAPVTAAERDYYGALGWYCPPGYVPPACTVCYAGYYGAECAACDDCAEHGTCYEGVGGNCTCNRGWAGNECRVCAAGYFGSDCTDCALCAPNGQGVCYDGLLGNCTCRTGWSPSPSCTVCAAGYYGARCDACAGCEVHGTCYEGLGGNCTCDVGWAGDGCTVCAAGYTGATCTTCAAGYFRLNGLCAPCAQCEFGTCSGETCACYEAWTGPTCSSCADGFYGADCFDCDVCAVHGYCIGGDAGACVCDAGWTGPKCQDPATAAEALEPWAWALIGGAGVAVAGVIVAGIVVGVTKYLKKSSSSSLVEPLLYEGNLN